MDQLIKAIQELKELQRGNVYPIYVTALLFAIALDITWLIVTFSCLLVTIFIIKVIKLYKKKYYTNDN